MREGTCELRDSLNQGRSFVEFPVAAGIPFPVPLSLITSRFLILQSCFGISQGGFGLGDCRVEVSVVQTNQRVVGWNSLANFKQGIDVNDFSGNLRCQLAAAMGFDDALRGNLKRDGLEIDFDKVHHHECLNLFRLFGNGAGDPQQSGDGEPCYEYSDSDQDLEKFLHDWVSLLPVGVE